MSQQSRILSFIHSFVLARKHVLGHKKECINAPTKKKKNCEAWPISLPCNMHLIFLFLYPFVDEENQNFGLDSEDHDA